VLFCLNASEAAPTGILMGRGGVPKAHPSGPSQESSSHDLIDDFSKAGDGELSWLGAQN